MTMNTDRMSRALHRTVLAASLSLLFAASVQAGADAPLP